jgi:hypothetical protein
MGKDKDGLFTINYQLFHTIRALDYKCLTSIKKKFPSINCKSPPAASAPGRVGVAGWPPLPPTRLAAGRVGFGVCGLVVGVGGQPIPARSAASWSASLHGSAGVTNDGS